MRHAAVIKLRHMCLSENAGMHALSPSLDYHIFHKHITQLFLSHDPCLSPVFSAGHHHNCPAVPSLLQDHVSAQTTSCTLQNSHTHKTAPLGFRMSLAAAEPLCILCMQQHCLRTFNVMCWNVRPYGLMERCSPSGQARFVVIAGVTFCCIGARKIPPQTSQRCCAAPSCAAVLQADRRGWDSVSRQGPCHAMTE